MPCSTCRRCSAVCWKYGWTSIWFTAGTTDVSASSCSRCSGIKVAHTDGAHLAVGEERLERPVGVEGAVEGRGQCVMQKQQVELIDA
jgi:hypothetical protein